MGAPSSTLAQGEDPLIREFWRMLDRLGLDDKMEVAGGRRLQCGDEMAARRAEWQRDSGEQIEGVIVSFFFFVSFFAVASFFAVVSRISPWLCGLVLLHKILGVFTFSLH